MKVCLTSTSQLLVMQLAHRDAEALPPCASAHHCAVPSLPSVMTRLSFKQREDAAHASCRRRALRIRSIDSMVSCGNCTGTSSSRVYPWPVLRSTPPAAHSGSDARSTAYNIRHRRLVSTSLRCVRLFSKCNFDHALKLSLIFARAPVPSLNQLQVCALSTACLAELFGFVDYCRSVALDWTACLVGDKI